MKIRFGYSDSDDRMWIRAGGDGPLWWVTRRLALRLVREWAGLMERSLPPVHESSAAGAGDDGAGEGGASGLGRGGASAVASGTQAESLAERVLREHRAALTAPRPSPPDGDAAGQGGHEPPPPPGASALLFAVDLGVRAGRIRLVLRSAGHQQAIAVPRDDGHRLLAALVSRCRRNGWLEARLPAWLEPPSERG